MEAYTGFAEVYDIFMDNVPYEEWAAYIISLLREYGIEDGILCELGCGTGKMTELLSEAGYDMIGVDASTEMLSIAHKSRSSDRDILYLCQDMRELELYGTVRAFVSVCDSLNYITDEKDLEETFALVNNYLDPGGIFIFDMNTEYKYRELLGDQTICENRETCSFIWENYYDEQERMNEYNLTLFVKEQDDLFRRFEEVHYQKCYRIQTVKEMLKAAGMEVVAVYDAFTKNAPGPESERVYFIAREIQKEI